MEQISEQTKIKVIMIEDDPQMSEVIGEYLLAYGMELTSYRLPFDGIAAIEDGVFDVLLLDLTLPQMDGLEVCRIIKQKKNIPIIITSARGGVSDKVVGLEMGADDYLPKPFDPRELVARIRAAARRTKEPKQHRETNGDFELNESAMEIVFRGLKLQLTPAEFEVLSLFIKNNGNVLSRDYIVDNVESMKWESVGKSVDVIVGRIRQKIGDDPRSPRYIKAVKGFGYRFCT